MIGVDTNVLLRAIMLDDRPQADRARQFLAQRSSDSPALINSVVLAEVVWSLRSYYEMPADEIASILNTLVSSTEYEFTNRAAVLQALASYENGVGHFTDRLIAEINDQAGCVATVTFDADAAKHAPFTLVP